MLKLTIDFNPNLYYIYSIYIKHFAIMKSPIISLKENKHVC